MGRPQPSNAVRDFSEQLARTITTSSKGRYDWVARIGKYSIFNAMSLLAPKVDLATDL
jgi:hypothetical protein